MFLWIEKAPFKLGKHQRGSMFSAVVQSLLDIAMKAFGRLDFEQRGFLLYRNGLCS